MSARTPRKATSQRARSTGGGGGSAAHAAAHQAREGEAEWEGPSAREIAAAMGEDLLAAAGGLKTGLEKKKKAVRKTFSKAGQRATQVVTDVVTEPARIVQDLTEVEAEVLTDVHVDLSCLFNPESWLTVAYNNHSIHARSRLGQHLSDRFRDDIRDTIVGALQGAMQGFKSDLPNLSERVLQQIPADSPFRTEMTETLKEYATNESWEALFESHTILSVTSKFSLDDLLESLIVRVMRRERLDTDILDLAAEQGLFSGNLFDLIPDLRGQFLRTIDNECARLRSPLEKALDHFSHQDHWHARVPERDVVTLVSKFSLGDVIKQTCSDLSDVGSSRTRRGTCGDEGDMDFEPRPRQPIRTRLRAFSLQALPAAGLRAMTPRFLRAFMPGLLARQPRERTCCSDFTGPLVVHMDYPKQLDDVFSIEVRVDFRHAMGKVVTRLLMGLPYNYESYNQLVGRLVVALDFPHSGREPFSATLILKERSFYKAVEEAVKQRQEDIKGAVPAKVDALKVGTDSKYCDDSHWRCVNKIRLRMNAMGQKST
eukprot:TRINITY_DN46919_c0_g1_i1.p1 TRINITY_DN46919_c0_g1~~TRINITY_DN46919_c0_g1_i1.p1  ORF type:complete len:542 (-),score=123.88 TRINITY_DN46919_c0_g1_i1:176-1801(-)